MNVLMTADCVGGVWSYALELSDALAAHDVSVTLAVMGGRLTAEQRRELRRSQVERCFASDFALEWQQNWASVRNAGDWLREIAERVPPNVVHVNGYAHAALHWDAPVVVVAHSCVLSWYEAVRGQAAPFEWDRYREEVARGLEAADVVVAPTQAMLDALLRHHPVRAQTCVVPNGVGAAEREGSKHEVVLAAGRLWDEAKNVGALVSVAPRLHAPIELAGDAAGPPPPHVRSLGRLGRDALRTRMAEVAVFCAPARYEPFGLGPLEAAQAGCALVLGDIPSLRELWEGAALFVAPEDGDMLLAALWHALADHERLGALARRRSGAYTAARMADAYADLYDRLALERVEVPSAARA
ncbi:MAG: glycosyltransferase family 4 protein [Gaiellaceae bacterium]